MCGRARGEETNVSPSRTTPGEVELAADAARRLVELNLRELRGQARVLKNRIIAREAETRLSKGQPARPRQAARAPSTASRNPFEKQPTITTQHSTAQQQHNTSKTRHPDRLVDDPPPHVHGRGLERELPGVQAGQRKHVRDEVRHGLDARLYMSYVCHAAPVSGGKAARQSRRRAHQATVSAIR